MTGMEILHATDQRLTPQSLREQIEGVELLVRDGVLRSSHDWGLIAKKKVLFKSGAERLLLWARLGHRMEQVDIERDDDGKRYGVTYRCLVHSLDNPNVIVATCDGYCGYDEPDREVHTDRWNKEVPRAPWNTIIKMAQKRALVGAALQATGTSSLFTQDLEDSAYQAATDQNRRADLGDVASMSNRDVVAALKDRDLPLGGKPDELRERLAQALAKETPPPADPETGEVQEPVSA